MYEISLLFCMSRINFEMAKEQNVCDVILNLNTSAQTNLCDMWVKDNSLCILRDQSVMGNWLFTGLCEGILVNAECSVY